MTSAHPNTPPTSLTRVARARLTDEIVERVPAPLAGETRCWDIDNPGFCVRVHRSGARSFGVKVKIDGKWTWRTIGAYGAWTSDRAREAAVQILTSAKGRHAPALFQPAAELPQLQQPATRPLRDRSLSIAELIEIYLCDGPASRPAKRASSWGTDASGLRRHVQPLLGHQRLAYLTQDQVAKMCSDIIAGRTACRVRTKAKGLARVSGGAGAAAVTLRTFKAMLSWAVARNLLPTNPAIGVRLAKAPRRERILSRAEAQGLVQTLDALASRGALNAMHTSAIKLLLLTGARRTEIIGLKWSEVDLARARLVLPPERCKTGGRTGERVISLNPPAVAIIAQQPVQGAFVFPAAKGHSGHFTGVQKTWCVVRDRAGLGSMRLHDLRHSFASFALDAGENILTISAALGHSSTQMTERYLHLRTSAADKLAARTAEFMLG